MIDSAILTTDLIGYLSFDVVARQATLVVCSPNGRPTREVSLIPLGPFATALLRLGIRLGRYRRRHRAIALDDCDGRTFDVWIGGGDRVVISDERGEYWLRSIDETTAAVRRCSTTVASPAVVTVVRRFGFDDVSRN